MFLSREFELYDFEMVMWEQKNVKSLGPDRISMNFYKEMWHVISPTYLQMCLEALCSGGMERWLMMAYQIHS